MLETYRGWEIREADTYYFSFQRYYATSPGYEASHEGAEDGWVPSGHTLNAATIEELKKDIDDFIEENSDAE